jgi:hypothetical protein
MPILESKIERRAVARIKTELGVTGLKLNTAGNTGWPDRIFLTPNKPVFIEFKRPGGKTSARQSAIIEYLKKLGYRAGICYDVETAFDTVKRSLDATSIPKERG